MREINRGDYEKLYKIVEKNKEAMKSIITDALTYINLEELGMGVFHNDKNQETEYVLLDLSDDEQRYEMVKRAPQFTQLQAQGYFTDFMPVIVQFYLEPELEDPSEGGHFTSMVLLNRETYLMDTKPVQRMLMMSI